MANHISHANPDGPIKGYKYTLSVPYLDASGTPTDPTSLDTELSLDNGAYADATNEVDLASGSHGTGILTLTETETNCSLVEIFFGCATAKPTLGIYNPRVLASVGTGTLIAGSAGGGTLGTLLAYDLTGCFVGLTGNTGSGQARKIVTYNTSTGAFTVAPNWESTPDNTTTYSVLLPEGVTLGMLKALNPTAAGRTLDVSAGGEAGLDWANVGSPTTAVAFSATTIGGIAGATQTLDALQTALNSAHGAGSWATATGFSVAGSAMTLTSGERTTLAASVLSAATATPIASDVKKVNAVTVNGAGTTLDPWGP